jgi:hypothetical protein
MPINKVAVVARKNVPKAQMNNSLFSISNSLQLLNSIFL